MSEFNFDRQKIKVLMEEAVFSLTHEPITILWCNPTFKSFSGQVKRERNGRLAIMIKPNLPLELAYKVFLHEIGHIHLGHCDDLEYIDDAAEVDDLILVLGPSLTFTDIQVKEYKEKPHECQADEFQRSIDSIATRHAINLFQTDDIEARIRALTKIEITKGEIT